jgi:hypothetical protein
MEDISSSVNAETVNAAGQTLNAPVRTADKARAELRKGLVLGPGDNPPASCAKFAWQSLL